MPSYARYHLMYPAVWTAMGSGRYRCDPGQADNLGAVRMDYDVLIDRQTGAIHGDAVSESTIFEVFGLPPVNYDLATSGSTVALVLPNARIRATVGELKNLVGRVTPGPGEGILIVSGLTERDFIGLLIAVLDQISALNEEPEDQGDPIQPKETLTKVSVLRTAEIVPGRTYLIDYSNHEGKRAVRQILVNGMSFGTNAYHLERGLIIDALDVERQVTRTFANAGIHAIWEYDIADTPQDQEGGIVCPRP